MTFGNTKTSLVHQGVIANAYVRTNVFQER